jgi:alkylation response protein AidB-like acyl-CoA dehydrogenase
VDFELSDSQELLRESVRRYLAEAAPLAWVRGQLEAPRGTTDAVWRGLAELGLTGLLVAEPYGGAGLGMLEMGLACEELGRALHPAPLTSSALGAASLIAALGSERERKDWLPALASGERVVVLALYEPEQRYAWRRPRCLARAQGAGWRLHGDKGPVADAVAADAWLVVAHDADSGAPGVFAVERGASGASVEPLQSVDGTRKQGALRLDGAPARRLGAADARSALAEGVDRLALGWAADGLGAAGRALELAREYALTRVQFDRPIGSFQAVQHLLVDMLADLELTRAGVYYALWAADAAEPAERHRAATMAKAFASRALPRLGASAIQVFGGVGFTWEYDIHLFYKRLLSLQAAFGDEAEHLQELARIALDATPQEGRT